jgi:hypothetical protein
VVEAACVPWDHPLETPPWALCSGVLDFQVTLSNQHLDSSKLKRAAPSPTHALPLVLCHELIHAAHRAISKTVTLLLLCACPHIGPSSVYWTRPLLRLAIHILWLWPFTPNPWFPPNTSRLQPLSAPDWALEELDAWRNCGCVDYSSMVSCVRFVSLQEVKLLQSQQKDLPHHWVESLDFGIEIWI